MYLVFDLETTIKSSFKRKANAFDPDNWVVARGWKYEGDAQNSWTYHPTHDRTSKLVIRKGTKLIVGFNLKFDLTWEMNQGNEELYEYYREGGKIWDCQYAEYLLEGQIDSVQMCSLDSIVEKYGGRKKIDQVKIMWENGISTENIPEDLLIDYLVGTEEEKRNSGDIGNTELVYLGQRAEAERLGMLKMIEDRMDGLLATTDMEFNGVKVDTAEAARRLAILNAELADAEKQLSAYIPADLPFEFNWGSRSHVSHIIFGGSTKYKVRESYLDDSTGQLARKQEDAVWPVFQGKAIDPSHKLVTYDEGRELYLAAGKVWQDRFTSGAKKGQGKTKKVKVPGELKIKWQDRLYDWPGYTKPNPDWQTKNVDGRGRPQYSTSADVIEELAVLNIPFLKLLGRKQSLDKEIGTYYVRRDPKKGLVGMLTCVQPTDKMLHHSLNHVNTVTTRLSANNPNMQNIPRGDKSEVKKMFVSRFGADGMMLEIDYSQLEVVVQGVLSGDKQLTKDLQNKIDFHCKRVAAKFGCTYEEALHWCKDETYADYKLWKSRRTGVKEFSFQRAYGAGAAAISAATGLPIEDVRMLIEQEDLLYPGVTEFNARVEAAVNGSASPINALGPDGNWKVYRRGYYRTPTGTRYAFRTYDAPDFLQKRGIRDSFSPPELKNYPVQGFGGEIVQAMIGLLFRHFIANRNYGNKAFLVNTVHDCVWFDVHKSVLHEVADDAIRIMQSVPEFYNQRHGMNIVVPFPVEAEAGPNMHELKHVGDH